MLVLSRRPGQSIQIGSDVTLTVIRIEGDRVVLGINAPRTVGVLRGELVEEVKSETQAASDARAAIQKLIRK